jgi:hypothetical protein
VYMEDDQIVPWNVQLEHGLEFIDNLSEDNAHDLLSFVCRGGNGQKDISDLGLKMVLLRR